MRILVSTSSLYGAGIGSYAIQLIRCLCASSYEVFVASPDLDSEQCDLPDTIKDAFHTPVGTNEADDKKTCYALLRFINRSQPDVIINNDNHFVSTLWPVIPRQVYRTSVVHSLVGPIARDGVLNWRYLDRIATIPARA